MSLFVDVLSWFLLVVGGTFVLAGGIGIVRLPDVFTRMHAAGVADTMGAVMILLGLIVQSGFHIGTFKLLLLTVFLLFIGPSSTHALAEAALRDPARPDISPLPEKEESTPSNT